MADASRRRVIVTRPKAPGRHPAILLVGGIGCFSFDTTIRGDRAMRAKERCMHALLVERQPLDQVIASDATCRPDVQYPAHYTYMQQVAALDIGAVWRGVHARVLVVYPTSDFITSEQEHRYLVDAINAMHPGQATFATVAGMDHYLAAEVSMAASIKDARGPDARPFSAAAFPVIDAWLDGVS